MAVDQEHPAAEEKIQEVDRIRDIIFGSQMRAYDGNFQIIQRDIDRLMQEIERLNEKLAEQEKSHAEKVQALEREMRKSDDGLRAELRATAQKLTDDKIDRRVLGDLFIELGSQLKSPGSIPGALKQLLSSKAG